MSAEHRKPVVAFVALAIIAAALVGMQRADARGGEILAAVIGAGAQVEGTLPEPVEVLDDPVVTFGSALLALADVPGETTVRTAGTEARPTSASDAAATGRDPAATPREVTSRRDGAGAGKPTSAGVRKAVKPRAAEKKRPSVSVRSNRPRQASARPRAASTTLRVAPAAPASTLQRSTSTTNGVGRAPQARATLVSKRGERPRHAVAPGQRRRSEHRAATHRPTRQARLHHVSRR